MKVRNRKKDVQDCKIGFNKMASATIKLLYRLTEIRWGDTGVFLKTGKKC